MANFDPDDPLGDLLSDESDDSFFDNPKARSSSEKAKGKKSVNEVFNLDSGESIVPATVPKANSAEDWLSLDAPKLNSSPARPKPMKKISFEDQDDANILNSLSLDQKHKTETKAQQNRSESAKKVSIMESLLGPSKDEGKKFLSLDDLLQETKSLKKQDAPTEVSQSATTLTDLKRPQSVRNLSQEAPKEGRRNRPRTANVLDPLGFFPTNPSAPDPTPRRRATTASEDAKTESTETLFVSNDQSSKIERKMQPPALGNVANWLGTEQKNDDVETPQIATSLENVASLPSAINPSMETILTQQKLAASNVEYQNTTIALQQQESQLFMALHLKKYEESMTDLQRKQQDVLVRQEQQFNSLLERQIAKQQTIENNIRLQQERINNHIQTLLLQPTISATSGEIDKVTELKKSKVNDIQLQFEEIINNLKQKQQNEILLLDESYKKQISTLEQSTESVENHLKMEIDTLNQKHRDKMEMVEEEHKIEITKYQRKIEEMHKHHEREIKQMRENSDRVVEEIKYEYNTIIENLKNAKNLEQSVLGDVNAYSAKLDASLKMLDINSRSLVEIHEKLHMDGNVLTEAREESIRAKQREIDQMRDALTKAREAADQERAQLMALVRNLEVKLSEQSQNAREERFALQQAAATLTARSSALDREAEFNRQSVERERAQLKVLQEAFLAEQEKIMLEITEEKLRLHSDKVRLETASKLSQNYDAEKAKVEVEAAIKVAKEAAEMTDRERENLMKQVREVEILKRTLHDKESRLNNLERDLEVAMQHAQRKNMLGEKALDESRMLQMNYNDKLREIQAQISSISTREKKLAEDKIAMSKERLALRNAKQTRRCGLCAVENQVEDNISDEVEQDLPRFISINDADMFRLQLQLSEDQLTTGGININREHPVI